MIKIYEMKKKIREKEEKKFNIIKEKEQVVKTKGRKRKRIKKIKNLLIAKLKKTEKNNKTKIRKKTHSMPRISIREKKYLNF